MKISIVHTVAWQEDHFSRLERLGEFVYHPGYPATPSELIERVGDVSIAIGADVQFSAEVVNNCPNLAMIALWSTGYDNVDLIAAKQRNILVSNVPGYSVYSVAEHTWAMALCLAKRLSEADLHVRSHRFDWSAIQGMELYGKTVGIIGLGKIGSHSAAIARGLGCHVVAYTKNDGAIRARELGIEMVNSLSNLLEASEIILLHVPLTHETRYMIDENAFAQMRKHPILVNTARGEIVHMEAALRAIQKGEISGLGLDVLWTEPPNWTDPILSNLLQLQQVIFSPHCGAHTLESFTRLTDTCLENIRAFLDGKPDNVVSF